MAEEYELSSAQKIAGNIIAGILTVVLGVFLMLVGFKVFPYFTLENIAFSAIFITIGLVFFISSLIQKNTVSLWLAFAFFTPATVAILNNFTPLSYAQLYPAYIAIPAISSLFTSFMSGAKKDHLKVIFFFGVIAGLFAIQSSGVLVPFGLTGWEVTIPALIAFIGVLITVVAIKEKKESENE